MQGERIKELRENLDLRQEDIADSVGVSVATASAWERGSKINSENLWRLAKTLNTSADFLLGLTDDPTPPHVVKDALSPRERAVINSMRRGDTVGAIRNIVNE